MQTHQRREEKGQKTKAPTHSRCRQFPRELEPDPPDLGQLSSPPTLTFLMKMLSWNIKGLNAQSKQCLLRERIMKEQLDILLLQETKCAREEASQILT